MTRFDTSQRKKLMKKIKKLLGISTKAPKGTDVVRCKKGHLLYLSQDFSDPEIIYELRKMLIGACTIISYAKAKSSQLMPDKILEILDSTP